MFYSELIGLCIGGYMELLIASQLTIEFGEYSTSGEKISIGLTILTLVTLFIWFPIVLYLIAFKFTNQVLNNEIFKKEWGAAYEDLDYKNMAARAYYLMFCARRTLFLAACFFMNKHFINQALIIILLNLLMLVYQGNVRPSASRYENNFDNFNEFLVLLTTESLLF